MDQHFFQTAFALNGDKAVIPEPTQGGGEVSYEQGFGPDYSLPNSNPARKKVPRQESNELYFNITQNIQDYQTHGIPQWITAANNGGVPYPYDKYAMCRHTDGSEVVNWISIVNGNDVEPGTDPTKWARAATILQPAGSYSGYVSVTGTPYTLLAANIGKLHVASAAASVINMLAIAGAEIGNAFTIQNLTSSLLTVNRDGASTFSGVLNSTTFQLKPYQVAIVMKQSAAVWNVQLLATEKSMPQWETILDAPIGAVSTYEVTDIPSSATEIEWGLYNLKTTNNIDEFRFQAGYGAGPTYLTAVGNYKGATNWVWGSDDDSRVWDGNTYFLGTQSDSVNDYSWCKINLKKLNDGSDTWSIEVTGGHNPTALGYKQIFSGGGRIDSSALPSVLTALRWSLSAGSVTDGYQRLRYYGIKGI